MGSEKRHYLHLLTTSSLLLYTYHSKKQQNDYIPSNYNRLHLTFFVYLQYTKKCRLTPTNIHLSLSYALHTPEERAFFRKNPLNTTSIPYIPSDQHSLDILFNLHCFLCIRKNNSSTSPCVISFDTSNV